MNRFPTWICFVLAICWHVDVLSQTLGGNAVFNFLDHPAGARTAALGGVNVSAIQKDVSMAFQNPALLRSTQHAQISSSFHSWIAGIQNYSLSFANRLSSSGWMQGWGLNYFSYGNLTQTDAAGNILGQFKPVDYVVQTQISKVYHEKFNWGLTAKFIHSSYGMYRSSGLAFDVGVNYFDSAAGWQAAVVVKNMGFQLASYVAGGMREELPFDVQAGISKKLANAPFQFSITARQLHRFNTVYNDTSFRASEGELNYTQVDFIQKIFSHITIGMQVYPHEKLELMAGYSFRRRSELNVFNQVVGLNGFTAGAALLLKKMHISYSTGFFQRNMFHSVSILVNWNGKM
ncbi:MAG: hypothetical protein EBX50_08310 [Chitinophagia bacterium]|nr:hypothetical protein [Chitinophagia bacterium]